MALIAEFRFMTAKTEGLIGPGRQRMADIEVTTVDVDHVIAEISLFMSKAGFVTFQAIALLMAGETIDRLTFGGGSVV